VSDDYWSWRDRLAEANDPRFWPIEAIDALVISGEGQFWCDGESAAVTRFNTYPGGAVVFEVIAVTGNLSSVWGQIAPAVEDYGRSQGSERIYATGRLGWQRSARMHGWEPLMIIITKDLTCEGY